MAAACGCAPRSIPGSRNMRRRRCATACSATIAGAAGRDRSTMSTCRSGWLQPFLNTNIGVDYEDWRAASRSIAMPAAGRSASTTARPAPLPRASRRCRCAARAARRSTRSSPATSSRSRPKAAAGRCARCPRSRAAWWSRIRAPAASGDAGRVRFAHPVVQPRHAGAAPAGLDDQAAGLCRGDGAGTDPRDDRRRWPVLRLAGRQSRPEMLPQFRQSARAPAPRHCAGASSNRAT
jgi:hypothetical protein